MSSCTFHAKKRKFWLLPNDPPSGLFPSFRTDAPRGIYSDVILPYLMDLLLTGEYQSQADQPNSLPESPPM